ncbi:hypothetical protein V5F34_06375 [Xanthobacter autotrophicus]|uniref:hypothetical protein n=1 Tax=Xanthobacter autotrophicus TaxID=280 RepID=UPI003726A28A
MMRVAPLFERHATRGETVGCGVDIGPSSERGPGRSWRHGENATTSPFRRIRRA